MNELYCEVIKVGESLGKKQNIWIEITKAIKIFVWKKFSFQNF